MSAIFLSATPDNGPMSHINDTYWIFIILAVIILLMIALRMYFWKKRREAAGKHSHVGLNSTLVSCH